MTELLNLTSEHIELINKTKRVLGNMKEFDSLKIYESEKHYVVVTKNSKEKYVTRTRVGKIHWRVIDSFIKSQAKKKYV
jgi:hypothetical protein